MAGMESGKFPPDTKLRTTACITYGGHCFPDHNGKGFGTIGYADALRQLGEGLGEEDRPEARPRRGQLLPARGLPHRPRVAEP